ncbi:MAG: hypothetical protein MH321_06650 [Leptospiraceae bacterium]|nr:hypothetical protein [Leptospiraceae bacterium]
MTLTLNYETYPKEIKAIFSLNEISRIDKIRAKNISAYYTNINETEEVFHLTFDSKDSNFIYADCLSYKDRNLVYCDPIDDSTENIHFIKDEDFYILKKKGFVFFNQKIAFINDSIKQNSIYFDDRLPKSISVSSDGLSRLITYHKARADLNDICYYQKYNSERNIFFPIGDCNKAPKSIK